MIKPGPLKFWVVPPSRYSYNKSILPWESQFFSLNFRHTIVPFVSLLLSFVLLVFGLQPRIYHLNGPNIEEPEFRTIKAIDDSCRTIITIKKKNEIYIDMHRLRDLEELPVLLEDICEESGSFDKNSSPLVALHIEPETLWGFIVDVLERLQKADVKTVWLIDKNIVYRYSHFIIPVKKVN